MKWNECSNPEMSNSRLVKVKLWCSQSLGARVMSGYLAGEGNLESLRWCSSWKRRKTHELVCPLPNILVSKPFSEPSQKLLMDSFLNWCYIRIGLNLATGINTAITISKYQESRHSLTGPLLQSLSKLQSWCWPGCTFSYWYLSGEESTSKLRGAVKFSSLVAFGLQFLAGFWPEAILSF